MVRVVRYRGRELRYTLMQTSRKEGIAAKVFPEGEIRVYMPRNLSLRLADQFVLQNAEQILTALEAQRKAAQQRPQAVLSKEMPVPVEGRERSIEVRKGVGRNVILEDRIVLWLNNGDDEEELRAALRGTLVRLALARLEETLRKYGPRVGKPYGRVTVRDQKTRWGSCSSAHNLNFNWRLIMAPPEVLEYVVIHELCHLWEFNHSKRFWELVEQQMPEYTVWKKWLKQHGTELQRMPI